ncbi:MAG: sigma 54-interacting transcriptional regulator, partial [Dehalobacterium sp.]
TMKGAFTGAITRPGLFEQAVEGTIFLDEINSMPLSLQAKLLRVLEEKKLRRLGGSEEININANIISSCNIEPMEAIKSGLIRPDLFYRLAVVYLQLPPLRDRVEDIELLAEYFIFETNYKINKNILGLREDVLSAFKKYHWPGNIRQLKHTIECAMSVSPITEGYLTSDNIPKYLNMDFSNSKNHRINTTVNNTLSTDIRKKIREKEKDTIIDVLNQTKGNLTKAAARLGMSRQSLWYRMKKYHLS